MEVLQPNLEYNQNLVYQAQKRLDQLVIKRELMEFINWQLAANQEQNDSKLGILQEKLLEIIEKRSKDILEHDSSQQAYAINRAKQELNQKIEQLQSEFRLDRHSYARTTQPNAVYPHRDFDTERQKDLETKLERLQADIKTDKQRELETKMERLQAELATRNQNQAQTPSNSMPPQVVTIYPQYMPQQQSVQYAMPQAQQPYQYGMPMQAPYFNQYYAPNQYLQPPVVVQMPNEIKVVLDKDRLDQSAAQSKDADTQFVTQAQLTQALQEIVHPKREYTQQIQAIPVQQEFAMSRQQIGNDYNQYSNTTATSSPSSQTDNFYFNPYETTYKFQPQSRQSPLDDMLAKMKTRLNELTERVGIINEN